MNKRSRIGDAFLVLFLAAIAIWFFGPVCKASRSPGSPEAIAFGDRFIRLLADKKWKETYDLTSDEYRKAVPISKMREEYESLPSSGGFFQSLGAGSGWPTTEESVWTLYETRALPPQKTWRANVIARVGQPDSSHTFVEVGAEAMDSGHRNIPRPPRRLGALLVL